MQQQRRSWTTRLPAERLELNSRDIDILEALSQYRFLTTTQLSEMFFPSKNFAVRRLRKLYDHGYIDRIHRPVTEGRAELLYALWTKGAQALARKLQVSRKELGWSKNKNQVGTEFLEHELEIGRFHLALEQGCTQRIGCTVTEWKSREELKLRKGSISFGDHMRDRGKTRILIPDSYFVLGTSKGRAHFFLEIDLYTETASKVFKQKMQSYKLYFERGLFQERYGAKNFRVLTIVPNNIRLTSLLQATRELGVGILFWFTISSSISPETIFKDIWRRADRPKESVAL